MALTRRELVHTIGATAGLRPQPGSAPADRTVHLGGDGVGLTPRAYAALLNELTQQRSNVAEATYMEAVLVRTAAGRVATEVGAILRDSDREPHPELAPIGAMSVYAGKPLRAH